MKNARVFAEKKLNLGCGAEVLAGYVNVDIEPRNGVILHDLNNVPYPFKEASFEHIRCHSILEHVKSITVVMEELQRILIPGGTLEIIVPHYTSPVAWGNPTHTRGFGHETFLYYIKGYSGNETYTSRPFSRGSARFIFGKKFQVWNWIIEAIANAFPAAYESTPLSSFPAMGVKSVLVK